MLDYTVLEVDISAALVDKQFVASGAKLLVLSTDDATVTFKIEDPANDSLPAKPTLEVCAGEDPDGTVVLFSKIFVSIAVGTGTATDRVKFIIVRNGNINLFSP